MTQAKHGRGWSCVFNETFDAFQAPVDTVCGRFSFLRNKGDREKQCRNGSIWEQKGERRSSLSRKLGLWQCNGGFGINIIQVMCRIKRYFQPIIVIGQEALVLIESITALGLLTLWVTPCHRCSNYLFIPKPNVTGPSV